MIRRGVLLVLGLLTASAGAADAQFFEFGQNKIQYRRFDWRVLKGEHVDLYYYPAEEELAHTALAYAEESYDSLAILSLYDWTDPLRDDRDATSFSYGLGAGMRGGSELFGRSRFGLEWDHTVNRLVSQRFRVLATLELEVFR